MQVGRVLSLVNLKSGHNRGANWNLASVLSRYTVDKAGSDQSTIGNPESCNKSAAQSIAASVSREQIIPLRITTPNLIILTAIHLRDGNLAGMRSSAIHDWL